MNNGPRYRTSPPAHGTSDLTSSANVRTRSFLSLFALLVAVFGVGATHASATRAAPREGSAEASIVKGRTASISAFPWLAFVEDRDATGQFSCTGTVVAPRVILTAGHCVQETEGSGRIVPPEGYSVTTGLSDLKVNSPANRSAVVQTLVFPGYRPYENRGDAGLLVLEAPVAAPAISLAGPSDGNLLAAGTPLTIAGWGLTNPNNREEPTVLREGKLEAQNSGFCRRAVRRFSAHYKPSWQLCALDRPRYEVSGCSGDSGGPAIAFRADGTPVEVGITSFGVQTCDPRSPGVYTRVDRVAEWVSSWIAAVEYGAQAPTITVPSLHIPHLSIPEAKELIAIGLGEDFRYRFTRAKAGEFYGCQRVESEKVKCEAVWIQSGNFYFGSVTAYLTLLHGAAVWDLRYKISWVDYHCYFQSGHPETCVFRTRRR
jgi:secreted trypsin-like serine protease